MTQKRGIIPSRGGFSLVEEVIALGIVSFALVGILGLIPIALSTSRRAMNISMETQIAQSLSRESFSADQSQSETKTHYYNEQGAEVSHESRSIIYKAVVIPKPLSISSAKLLSSTVAKQITVEITNITTPSLTNSFPIVVVVTPPL